MKHGIIREQPDSNKELRLALYSGDIFLFPACDESMALRKRVEEIAVKHLGNDYRRAQFEMEPAELYRRVKAAKDETFGDHSVRDLAVDVINAYGFDLDRNAFDPPRFRAVRHLGHESEGAIPAYWAHRDTWYANPQSQINWWMPLHDVSDREAFCFYPRYLEKPVKNSSAFFNYDEWIKDVGFGRSQAADGAFYPGPIDWTPKENEDVGFSLSAGELVLFSAAHLHRTLENVSGLTRLSIDFRTVHLKDEKDGIGALNVDNKSTGSSLVDYIHPVAVT